MASTLEREEMLAVAEFIVPDWGDKVNSGIGLSYRPATHVAWRAGMSTLCQSLTFSSQSGTMNSATVLPIKVDLGPKGPTPSSLLPQMSSSNMAILRRGHPSENLERGHIN
jgi:hypothetical protein